MIPHDTPCDIYIYIPQTFGTSLCVPGIYQIITRESDIHWELTIDICGMYGKLYLMILRYGEIWGGRVLRS